MRRKRNKNTLGLEKALESEQKSPNRLANLEELAYTWTHMEEQWAFGLEYEAKAEQEYELLITLSSNSWYSHKAWLAHFEAYSTLSLPW